MECIVCGRPMTERGDKITFLACPELCSIYSGGAYWERWQQIRTRSLYPDEKLREVVRGGAV